MPSSTYDIVVIGSGLGGLTAANRLARKTAMEILHIEYMAGQ